MAKTLDNYQPTIPGLDTGKKETEVTNRYVIPASKTIYVSTGQDGQEKAYWTSWSFYATEVGKESQKSSRCWMKSISKPVTLKDPSSRSTRTLFPNEKFLIDVSDRVKSQPKS